MNGVGGDPAGAGSQNNRGRTGDDVAAGPDPGFHGLAGLWIGHDVTPFIQDQTRSAFGQERVGAGTDGNDRRVDVHDKFRTGDGYRTPAPRGVGLAEFHAQTFHAGEESVGAAQ